MKVYKKYKTGKRNGGQRYHVKKNQGDILSTLALYNDKNTLRKISAGEIPGKQAQEWLDTKYDPQMYGFQQKTSSPRIYAKQLLTSMEEVS